MQNIKPQLDFTNMYGFFNDKLHLLNDTLIPYNYFFKVYVIQKKLKFTTFRTRKSVKEKRS